MFPSTNLIEHTVLIRRLGSHWAAAAAAGGIVVTLPAPP